MMRMGYSTFAYASIFSRHAYRIAFPVLRVTLPSAPGRSGANDIRLQLSETFNRGDESVRCCSCCTRGPHGCHAASRGSSSVNDLGYSAHQPMYKNAIPLYPHQPLMPRQQAIWQPRRQPITRQIVRPPIISPALLRIPNSKACQIRHPRHARWTSGI